MGVLPESSYIHTVHSGQRNQEQAKVFVEQIKGNSDGRAPFFESDGWFYEEVLTDVYGTLEEVPYKGKGRKPFPRQMPDPELKYAQVVKERDNGKAVSYTHLDVYKRQVPTRGLCGLIAGQPVADLAQLYRPHPPGGGPGPGDGRGDPPRLPGLRPSAGTPLRGPAGVFPAAHSLSLIHI